MQIGFDARSLARGGTGDLTYFRELIAAMARLEPENNYTLYYREEDDVREAFAAQFSSIHTKKIDFPIGWLWNQCAVAPRLRRDGIDVFHSQYLLPPRTSCPAVVTIHDVTFRLFPRWTPPRARRLMNVLIPLAARTSRLILTGSQHSREDIIRCFKINPAKVVVTPYAVSEHFRETSPQQNAEVISHYDGLTAPYIFGAGLRGARKNIQVILRATQLLKQRGEWPDELLLALTGEPHHFMDAPTLTELSDHVRFLGYVPDADLPALYGAAQACVYPSLYEGFGLPPLEAMACGCPVLCSNTSSLPEVVGDAGSLLPPEDAEAWAEALSKIIGDDNLRNQLRQAGLARAGLFSWERTARETFEAYRSLL